MKRLALALLVLPMIAFGDLKVKVNYTPISNLVYQLDCVGAPHIACSQKTFEDLWKKNFLKSETDQELVKTWGELTQKKENLDKIRMASFQATSLSDYLKRLELVLTTEKKQHFEKIVNHFYPRFETWWKKVAAEKGSAFVKQTEALIKEPKISNQIKKYAQFYEAQFPNNFEVTISLFYRPQFEEATKGQQIENHSLVEFIPIEKAVDRIDVIIHELCHFFFDQSPEEKRHNLKRAFANTNKIEAIGAYNLLNETVATALGNGLINKMLMTKAEWKKYSSTPGSFYNDPPIDRSARAIYLWLEEVMANGKTIFAPEFFSTYLSTVEKALGNELARPMLILKEMVLVADKQYEESFSVPVRRALRLASQYTSEAEWSDPKILEQFHKQSSLSSIVIVHPKNVLQLRQKKILTKDQFNDFNQNFRQNKNVLFGYRRGPNVKGYVITAENYDEVLKLVHQLANLPNDFDGALGPEPK